MLKHYTQKDFEDIDRAKNFKDLGQVAINVLKRMPGPVIQVCGPISTGGKGNVKDNLLALDKAIIHLKNLGHNIFYQLPLEDKTAELDKKWKIENPSETYCQPILDDIYKPLFESGLIKQLWFLPGWESSRGATWEREQGKRLGIEICDLEN